MRTMVYDLRVAQWTQKNHENFFLNFDSAQSQNV